MEPFDFSDEAEAATAELIEQLEDTVDELTAENESLRKQLMDYEEREGLCCPEGVTFDEHIKVLRAQLAAFDSECSDYVMMLQYLANGYDFSSGDTERLYALLDSHDDNNAD